MSSDQYLPQVITFATDLYDTRDTRGQDRREPDASGRAHARGRQAPVHGHVRQRGSRGGDQTSSRQTRSRPTPRTWPGRCESRPSPRAPRLPPTSSATTRAKTTPALRAQCGSSSGAGTGRGGRGGYDRGFRRARRHRPDQLRGPRRRQPDCRARDQKCRPGNVHRANARQGVDGAVLGDDPERDAKPDPGRASGPRSRTERDGGARRVRRRRGRRSRHDRQQRPRRRDRCRAARHRATGCDDRIGHDRPGLLHRHRDRRDLRDLTPRRGRIGRGRIVLVEPPGDALADSTSDASISASQFDPTPSNDSGARRRPRCRRPAPRWPTSSSRTTQSSSQDTLGGTLIDTIIVVNNGPGEATGVDLTDALDAAAQVTAIDSGAFTCSSGAAVQCSLAELAPGASETLEVHVRPLRRGLLIDDVTASDDQFDPNYANDSAKTTATVTPNATAAKVRTSPFDQWRPRGAWSASWSRSA